VQVDFYHLTGSPVERILPRIAERILEQGGRLLVVAQDEGLATRLDSHFWNYTPESFLPHGRAGDGAEARHPVLISATVSAPNEARNIALADGVWREEALTFDRAFLLFGEDRIDEARQAWRSLGNQERIERRFWKQDEAGKWSLQA
jgi:DNA polymerase III, chi subunit